MSSSVAVSGDPTLQKRNEPLAAVDVAPLRVRTKLARVHVFSIMRWRSGLTDRIPARLSQVRLMTP